MKQLKFMLAAATAIGLATAAQADTVTPLVNNDTFDGEYTVTEKVDGVDTPVTKTFVKGLAITDVPGYEYLGSDDDGENDSVVDEVGYPNSGNALKVNTGTAPVARQINKGSELNLTAVKSVYIDTMVQFTVTPYSDKDNVNPTIGQDKLMIYLQEGEADADGNKPLSLMAIAGFAGDEGSFEAKPYKLVGMNNVQPNKWYHLVVESYADISTQDPAGEDFVGYFPGFRVFLTDPLAEPSEPAALTYEGELGGIEFEERFPGEGLLSLALVGGGNEAGLAADDVTLTYVGFAGEGVVDNLSVSTITAATSVDFTLALDESVSSVKFTVGGNTYTLDADTLEMTIEDLDLNSEAEIIEVKYAEYCVPATGDLIAGSKIALNAATVSKVVKASTKLDEVKSEVTAEVATTTYGVAADAPIFTSTSDNATEAGAEITPVQIGKILDWNNRVNGGKIADVNSMKFVAGVPAENSPSAEAFLLNCSTAELANEKEEFKFSPEDLASLMTSGLNATGLDADKEKYIGEFVLEGASALNGEATDWKDSAKWTGEEKPAFYRARLIFK